MSKDVKVNFSVVLQTLDGKPMKEVSGVQSVAQALQGAGMSPMLLERALNLLKPLWESGEPEDKDLTAGRCVANALQVADNACPGAERVDRMRLALKVIEGGMVDLKAAEVATILKSVEKGYDMPVVYFRISDLLSKDSVPPVREGVH